MPPRVIEVEVTDFKPRAPRPAPSQEELQAAFDKVKPRADWKMPINRVIDAADEEIVGRAVIHFTGGIATFEPTGRRGRVRCRAAGYYASTVI